MGSSRRLVLLAAGLTVLVVLGVAAWRAGPGAPRFHGTVPDEITPAAEFSLREHTGREVTLADYRGHPVVLFFGYTRCPDVCPLTLSRLSRAAMEAGRGAEDLRILLITVDPQHDTPESLGTYVSNFGPTVRGLTGTPEELEQARAAYGVHAASGPAAAHAAHGRGGGMIGHTPVVFGIDREGRLRAVFGDETRDDDLTETIRALIRS